MHGCLNRFQRGLHVCPVDPPTLIHVPHPKHNVAQRQPIRGPPRDRPAPLAQHHEIADQMRPAALVAFCWLTEVGAPAIRNLRKQCRVLCLEVHNGSDGSEQQLLNRQRCGSPFIVRYAWWRGARIYRGSMLREKVVVKSADSWQYLDARERLPLFHNAAVGIDNKLQQ